MVLENLAGGLKWPYNGVMSTDPVDLSVFRRESPYAVRLTNINRAAAASLPGVAEPEVLNISAHSSSLNGLYVTVRPGAFEAFYKASCALDPHQALQVTADTGPGSHPRRLCLLGADGRRANAILASLFNPTPHNGPIAPVKSVAYPGDPTKGHPFW